MDILILIIKTWSLGLLLLLLLQFVVFLFAYRKKRLDIIDVFWGLSFITVCCLYALLNFENMNFANLVAFLCIAIWGFRLASHIYIRFKSKNVQDKRYTDITKSYINKPFLVFIKVFAVQALLASIVTVVFMVSVFSPRYNGTFVLIGLILWLFGFIFESIADFQLKKHITSRSGELMKTGLWKYSRHPNYFGELTQWWAIWLMTASGTYSMLGLVGPLSISILIIFVSGIPPLEKHMAEKEGWIKYKKTTSAIIPWFST